MWHRPATAALIQLLAWELLYVTGTAIKRKKKKKEREREKHLCILLTLNFK